MRTLGDWARVSVWAAALGGFLGGFIGLWTYDPSQAGPTKLEVIAKGSGLGAAIAVPLVLVPYVFFLRILAAFWRVAPRERDVFGSFTGSYRFPPSPRPPTLPFKFVPLVVGGVDQLRSISKRLSVARVAICDSGGTGKTTLAAAVLCRIHSGLRGGSIWISVDGKNLEWFLGELALLLECREAQDRQSAVRTNLAKLGRCLVVVDNLETADGDVIEFLRKEIPANCLLLTTTRYWEKGYQGIGERFVLREGITPGEFQKFGRTLVKQKTRKPLGSSRIREILGVAGGNAKIIELLLGQYRKPGFR